jgi:hypothetical protein
LEQFALHIIQPHQIQLHMEPLVIQSLGYDLALSQGITELPCLQGNHDAGLWIMFQQCLRHTSTEVVEATLAIQMMVYLTYHATYPIQQ